MWNKRGTCIFAYLPKICKPPTMHFTSFCIELELNINSPIAQETPRSSILQQHHASFWSFLARRKGNLFSYLTGHYLSNLRPPKGKCFFVGSVKLCWIDLVPLVRWQIAPALSTLNRLFPGSWRSAFAYVVAFVSDFVFCIGLCLFDFVFYLSSSPLVGTLHIARPLFFQTHVLAVVILVSK